MTFKQNHAVAVTIVFVALLAGVAGGILIGASDRWPLTVEAPQDDAGDRQQQADDHADVVQLSKKAYKSLGIKLQQIALTDYYRNWRIPAQVIEKLGHSDHALSAPVTGIVSRVHVFPGQAVRTGDPLFDLQVNDEPLTTAQVSLLETVARLETLAAEIKRLGPL
ncbi:MAG: hypothetical protein VX257_10435, partial [Planctomycetota bacterium]|nr:hypothetical protein [Planctomycetota bacterium]